MNLAEAAIFAVFAVSLVLWIIPGLKRILAKRHVMEVTGAARSPRERRGYDRRDWAVLFGVIGWLVLFPTALWLMDNGYL